MFTVTFRYHKMIMIFVQGGGYTRTPNLLQVCDLMGDNFKKGECGCSMNICLPVFSSLSFMLP